MKWQDLLLAIALHSMPTWGACNPVKTRGLEIIVPYHLTMPDSINIPPTADNQTHLDESNPSTDHGGVGNSQSTLGCTVQQGNQRDRAEDAHELPFPGSLLYASEIPGLLTKGESVGG